MVKRSNYYWIGADLPIAVANSLTGDGATWLCAQLDLDLGGNLEPKAIAVSSSGRWDRHGSDPRWDDGGLSFPCDGFSDRGLSHGAFAKTTFSQGRFYFSRLDCVWHDPLGGKRDRYSDLSSRIAIIG